MGGMPLFNAIYNRIKASKHCEVITLSVRDRSESSSLLSDRLLNVLKTNNSSNELRHIIIKSKLWPVVSEEVYTRLNQLITKEETGSQHYSQLQMIKETLIQIELELNQHNNIINDFQTSIPSEFFAL